MKIYLVTMAILLSLSLVASAVLSAPAAASQTGLDSYQLSIEEIWAPRQVGPERATLHLLAVSGEPGTSDAGVTIYARSDSTGQILYQQTTSENGTTFTLLVNEDFYLTTTPYGCALGGAYGFERELECGGVATLRILKRGNDYFLCNLAERQCTKTNTIAMHKIRNAPISCREACRCRPRGAINQQLNQPAQTSQVTSQVQAALPQPPSSPATASITQTQPAPQTQSSIPSSQPGVVQSVPTVRTDTAKQPETRTTIQTPHAIENTVAQKTKQQPTGKEEKTTIQPNPAPKEKPGKLKAVTAEEVKQIAATYSEASQQTSLPASEKLSSRKTAESLPAPIIQILYILSLIIPHYSNLIK